MIKKLKQLESDRLLRTIIVPTDDLIVQKRLKILNAPITLLEETIPDRRDRLRQLMVEKIVYDKIDVINLFDHIDYVEEAKLKQEQDAKIQLKAYFTEGSEALKAARLKMHNYSLEKYHLRMENMKNYKEKILDKEYAISEENKYKKYINNVRDFSVVKSEIAGNRAISAIKYNSSNEYIISGSWDGSLKLWKAKIVIFCIIIFVIMKILESLMLLFIHF